MAAASIKYAKKNTYTNHAQGMQSKGVPRFKVGYVTCPNTASNGDTFTVDIYKQWGMQRLLAVEGFIHTTENSVMVQEAPTTVVDVTNLTITVGGAVGTKKRFYAVYGV